MKFDIETIEILENFQKINPSILIEEGNVLRTTSKTQTISAKSTVPNEFDRAFAIYDLNKFLRTISFMRDCDVEFSERYLTLKNDNSSIKYGYCDPEMIHNSDKRLKNINEKDVYLKFVLSPDMITQAIKAMNVLSHSGICVVGEEGKLLLKTWNTDGTADSFSLQIGETDKKFNLIFESDKLVFLPRQYDVTISKIKFAHLYSGKVEYWLAAHMKSTFNE